MLLEFYIFPIAGPKNAGSSFYTRAVPGSQYQRYRHCAISFLYSKSRTVQYIIYVNNNKIICVIIFFWDVFVKYKIVVCFKITIVFSYLNSFFSVFNFHKMLRVCFKAVRCAHNFKSLTISKMESVG